MRPLHRTAKTILSCLLSIAPLAAQADEALLVERSVDRAGRDRLVRMLRTKVMDLKAEDMTAKELSTYLEIAADHKINFMVMARDIAVDDLPTITLSVNKLNLLSLMAIVARQTDLRFVYTSGVVLIKPKDEVREQRILRVYDLSAATAPLRDFPGPRLEIRKDGSGYEELEEQDSDKTISGFNIDDIQELVRQHVAPESWDEEGISLSASRETLFVRQSARNHEAVTRFLITIGVIPAHSPRAQRAAQRRALGRQALRDAEDKIK